MPIPLALPLVFLSILVPLVAFGWFFGALAVEQISGVVTQFPEWWDKTVAKG